MTVAKDSLDSVGRLLGPGEGGRDAVHIAMFPSKSVWLLKPGQPVAMAASGRHVVPITDAWGEKTVGIVDPFLTKPVEPGQRFWVFLFPRTITALRHVWSHPAFPEGDK